METPIGISEIRQFLCELSRTNGTTIFISSHVLSEIEQIADMIGVINQGKLVEEVNMQELQKRKRQYIAFTVSDLIAATMMLKNRCKVRDYEVQDHMIKIFKPEFNIGYYNQILVENQVVVTGI